ncbi:MAG: hypothetical protein HYV27_06145 [Candidatus Hydrogenedentes bacterium]|nr:hypothetical protein [Candidatus Hydrogenedentota bacterium]
MRQRRIAGCLGLVLLLSSSVLAATYSVPEDKQDEQKILFGSASTFEKPAEVDYKEVIMATPEYQSIKKKKVPTGSAKYWILMSQASDHALRTIAGIGDDTDYDLIAVKGFLGELDEPIEATDITEDVLAKLEDE